MKTIRILSIFFIAVIMTVSFSSCFNKAGNELNADDLKMIEKIEADYKKLAGREEPYLMHYYGKIGKGYPVMMGGMDAGQMIHTDTIGGVDFMYPDTLRIIVWYDGEFLTLSEAYGDEILSVDDLKTLQGMYYRKEYVDLEKEITPP